MPNPRGRGRPKRAWRPSEAQLQNIADAAPQPPSDSDGDNADQVNAINFPSLDIDLDEVFGDIFPTYFDIVMTVKPADITEAPSSVPKALGGPDSARWQAALDREVTQHDNNGTFGPALDPKDLPPNCKPIPFEVILKDKRDGTAKARGIIKGFHMT